MDGPRWIYSPMIASMYEMTLTLGSIFFNGNKIKCSYFRVSHKTSLKVTLDWSKRHTQKPVKHLRWTFFPKINNDSKSFPIFAKSFILDASYGSEHTSA